MGERPNAAVHGSIGGLGRHIGWTYVQLGASVVTWLLVTALALRRLGADDFGVFALIAAISSFLLVLGLGLGFSVVRAAAREEGAATPWEREAARRELQLAHAAYCRLGAVALLAVLGLVAASPVLLPEASGGPVAVAATAGLVGLQVALTVATSALPALATGRKQFRLSAVATISGAITNLGIVVVFVDRLGLVALGIGSLAAVVVNRTVVAVWLVRSAPWFPLLPRRLGRGDLRRTLHVALPLLALTVGGQVITTTDLVVLAVLESSAVVGLYRLGSSLPTQAIGVLYQGYDVVFPSLAGSTDRDAQEATMRFLTRVASYLGGLGLGVMALLRDDLVLLVSGNRSSLAASVLLAFCLIWLITLTSHGLSLLLIARGRERVLLPLLVAEMVVNLILTVVLVGLVGPVGAAYATMATLLLSSGVLFPALTRREFSSSVWRVLAVDGVASLLVGVLVAAPVWAAVSIFPSPATRTVLATVATAAVGAVVGLALLGRAGRAELSRALRRPQLAQPVEAGG